MKTIRLNLKKYKQPDIDTICIDPEISLALQSTPPTYDNETHLMQSTPDYFNQNNYQQA